MASNVTQQATGSGDLVDLVSSSGSATIYPNDDSILSVLQSRFRADLPYTRIGATHLVVVNPYKTLASLNDVNAHEYEERCYKDTSLPMSDSPRPLQPHIYELAARMYFVMRRTRESQALVSRGITGSGKSSTTRLLINQLLRMSAHSKKELKLVEQIKALGTVIDSFGNAKTVVNPNASRHGRYIELHFNEHGGISGAKTLTFGLDKHRLNRLSHEERTYHVFYQFLAGATSHERDAFFLEDPSEYALLASSGCYRLPAGPFSDDGIAMEDLRAALRSLGFKQRHITSIFSLVVAVLLLGNIQFIESDFHDVSAQVANPLVLDHAARLLGVSPEDLSQALTNKTNYVRKELFTVLLNAEQSSAQRDSLVRDLYAILFAFVVETANHKLCSAESTPTTQIVVTDLPGFQNKGSLGTSSVALYGSSPLVSAYGQNGFEEFSINFCDELIHSYVVRNTFDDTVGYNSHLTSDSIALPSIAVMENSACVELLRGAQLNERAHRKSGGLLGTMSKACSAYKSGKGAEKRNEDMVQDFVTRFGVHASFVASPGVGGAADRNLFGINHYSGPCSYDASQFIERDSDLLDSAFVTLFRNSTEPFITKLLSGPSLAAETHAVDEQIIVQAQVSSRPLRQPTPIATGTSTPEDIPRLDPSKTYPITTQLNFVMSELFANIDHARLWYISCIRPNDSGSSNSFDKRRVKAQVRSLLLADVASRRSVEYVADFLQDEFCERYVPTMRGSDLERITQCARANGWKEGVDFAVGHRSVWLAYSAFKMAEDVLRAMEKDGRPEEEEASAVPDDATDYTHGEGGAFYDDPGNDYLLNGNTGYGGGGLPTPEANRNFADQDNGAWGSGWDKGGPSGDKTPSASKENDGIVIKDANNAVEEVPSSTIRRVWLWLTWGTTWWIPTFLLKSVGRIKRPDVQLAWREKFTICWLIFLANAFVIFYIIGLGKLLCPKFDKAWSSNEVAQHVESNDWWVSIQGRVYDLSNYIHGDHSGLVVGVASNGPDTLEVLAGQDLTYYFPPPLTIACQGLVTAPDITITPKNFTANILQAMHKSGPQSNYPTSKLNDINWYGTNFAGKNSRMSKYYKGPLVWEMKEIKALAADQDIDKIWAVYEDEVFDLTDYFHSISLNSASQEQAFLNKDITDVFNQRKGQDISKPLRAVLDTIDPNEAYNNMVCIKNMFKIGDKDFRKGARCQVQNWLLIAFAAILMSSMALKFLAALQLGSKRSPELQDKFIICQVPCYTEGEDSLRRTIDSLTALEYDDKRKLIFIICDGNIIGSGNDRTTPRIALDILGVDPKLDPEPLLFKSVGEGSKALNYAKVYSGLYEYQGHVVPYMVVVKVGKPTERSKPGNRGKRDSQILLMQYLNRVHFDSPMCPLELEIYHQMRNVIGIDPAFYEYIFTVDADTTVTPPALNRLVACCADDSGIIGICGETKLENPEGSWWTMIQVYEYYISHHLSKAFESLFGSVTCLPGCFSLYRIRTADKGRPIIISGRIIDEYAEPNVDTLHKKNLFSLGEDRFLTTLLMKHFPTFKTKFTPDAIAHTVAPDSFRVLFSQRRRWINSTVHNLCELVILPELFGFCCFSMRFFVFVDLLGTIILPSTVVYIVYLIVTVSSGRAALPIISIIMIGIVYGLQALIFILKREFMLVGWMVVYILSYPVYSFFLPVYSFWCMDEFSWGNTRLVVGEGKDKKVLVNEDEKFDDSMIPLKKFSEYEAEAWDTQSRRSVDTGYSKPRSRVPPSRQESPPNSDYYRNTNVLHGKTSQGNLRTGGSQMSHSNHSFNHHPQNPFASMNHLPMMPFGGSQAGSDYGGGNGSMMQMPMMGPLGYQNTGSAYGMGMPMMPGPMGMMPTGGSFGGSQMGGLGGNNMAQQRMSTFSLATTVNPFAGGPSQNANPTDDELYGALKMYLSTQDLMTVTKKTAREAIAARFPKADLSTRKDFLNQSIDNILSGS